MNNSKKRVLSVFSLVMINVIAIDSLRNLPINAEYGYAIAFFYILGAICFLFPCALVSAEMATEWPQTGGSYVWVREAFGKRIGFLSIWLEWIYNVVWYPTILTFVGTTIAYLVNPHLVDDKFYMVSMIVITFAIATVVNTFGMKTSSLISSIGAIGGTMGPMILLIILGIIWLVSGKNYIQGSSFLPNVADFKNISFLIVVMFSLMGIEMSSVHAEEVKNPARDYPRALLISSVLIVATLIFASLAIGVAVPQKQLSIVNGLNQAFQVFFDSYGLGWLFPVIEVLIIIGGFAGLATWVIGPTKGLMIAAKDGSFPEKLAKTNRYGAPRNILFLQALIVILLSIAFVVFPTISSAYWVLSDLTAQLAIIYYITVFASAIYLRYKYPERKKESFKIPGGKIGVWLVGGLGLLSCLAGLVIGFVPPASIQTGSMLLYEGSLIVGIIIFTLPAFLIRARKQDAS